MTNSGRREEIDAVRARTDIVEVISKYVPLTQKGREYVGVCPFHDDHDPSMRVSPEKQIFKCFVCGAGGDVFGFLQKIEHISFMEAVSKAAQAAGVPFRQAAVRNRPVSPFQPLYSTLQTFIDYAGYMLSSREGRKAREYLNSRKFTPEILEGFQIGFAPDAGTLSRFFQAKKIEPRLLEDTGLTAGRELYPRFHDRIIIPIHDAEGHPIGLTARILPGSDTSQAKYINTTRTPVYEKGQTIFNFHRVKDLARKEGYVVLVEGAMDVLGLEKAGIHTGVAMLGTALTSQQMRMLYSLGVSVRVFYDNDAAGQKAVWKFGQAAMQAGVPFVVVQNDQQKDPDDIFIEQGSEAVRTAVSHTVSFAAFAFEFLLSQYDLNNYEDKKTYAATMADIIRRNADVHEAGGMYERLKELTGLDYSNSQPVLPQPFPAESSSPFTASYEPQMTADRYPVFGGYENAYLPEAPADIYPDYTGYGDAYVRNFNQSARRNGVSRQKRSFSRNNYRQNRQGSSSDVDDPLLLPAVEEGRLQAEKAVLAAMLTDKKYAERFKSEIGFFKNPVCHQLSLYIYEAYRHNPNLDPESLKVLIEETEIQSLLSELQSIEQELISDNLYWDSLFKIKDVALSEQIELTAAKMKQTNDSHELMDLLIQKKNLIRQRNALRQRKDVPNG